MESRKVSFNLLFLFQSCISTYLLSVTSSFFCGLPMTTSYEIKDAKSGIAFGDLSLLWFYDFFALVTKRFVLSEGWSERYTLARSWGSRFLCEFGWWHLLVEETSRWARKIWTKSFPCFAFSSCLTTSHALKSKKKFWLPTRTALLFTQQSFAELLPVSIIATYISTVLIFICGPNANVKEFSFTIKIPLIWHRSQ